MSTTVQKTSRVGDYIHIEDRPALSLEQFFALPDHGKDLQLVFGRLWERDVTYRNRFHSRVETRINYVLENWLRQQPEPRGWIVSGEAGFLLPTHPPSVVGIDVAYVSAELLASTQDEQRIFHGAPVLAVEILSGSESVEEIDDKVTAYREVGAVLWIAHPRFRTITVSRPEVDQVLYNASQILDADPYLPGFRVPVAELFEM